MASLELEGFDDLLKGLSQLKFDELAPEMLEAAGPTLRQNLTKRMRVHSRTGDLVDSISAGKVKKVSGGYTISVRPTGTDSKGVRNMEKAVYMEYGTEKQAATPVFSPAIAESEDAVNDKMQEVFNKHTKGL